MYDNTDERGEDAVAQQRGGSERPQHVDTCRVYNCYGCEEIVDEPGHLPECPAPQPEWNNFCICDRLRSCEARVQEDEDRMVPIIRRNEYQRGLDAAREAVALMPWSSDTWQAHDERTNALAAIDALREGK